MLRGLCVLASLRFGICVADGACVPDASGIQLCNVGTQVDDATLLQQISTSHSSSLLQHRVWMQKDSVHSLESSMKSMASKSVDGAVVPADMMTILDDMSSKMQSFRNGTQQEHKTDVGLIQGAVDLLAACGTAATDAHTKGAGINDVASQAVQKRSTHNECRVAEKDAKSHKDEKCQEWAQFQTDLNQGIPSCGCNIPEPPEMLQCVKKFQTWAGTYSPANYESKAGACEAKTTEHSSKKSTCDTEQGAFEQGFCSYAQLLTSTCTQQVDCRAKEIANKQNTCQAVKSNAEVRKTEYASAVLVQCYIQVLKIDEGKINEKKAKMAECVQTVDTTSLDITCPDDPAASVCDASVVERKPCSNEWVSNEYTEKAWYADAPTKSCTECAALAPAATTSAAVVTIAGPANVIALSSDTIVHAPPTYRGGHYQLADTRPAHQKYAFHCCLSPIGERQAPCTDRGYFGPDQQYGTTQPGPYSLAGNPEFYVTLDLGKSCRVDKVGLENSGVNYGVSAYSLGMSDSQEVQDLPVVGTLESAKHEILVNKVHEILVNKVGRYLKIKFDKYLQYSVGIKLLELHGACE